MKDAVVISLAILTCMAAMDDIVAAYAFGAITLLMALWA